MEELIALVEVISKNKVKQIEIIGNTNVRQTQVQQLYEGIANGSLLTDEQIISDFFPESEGNSTFYCNRLKKKLKERLINTLFFIDVNRPSFNEYNRAYFSCYRHVAAAKILIGLFARKAAIPLAEKTLEIVSEFEFTELTLSLAKDLRTHYGNIEGNKRKFEEMNQLVLQKTEILIAETRAEQYYTDLMVNFIKSKATKPEIEKKACQYAKDLQEIGLSISSPRFNYLTYLVSTLRYEVTNDYKNTLKVCKKAIDYFEPKRNKVAGTTIFMFALKMLACHIYLKNYKEAQQAVEKCLVFSQEGTTNWFLTFEYALILSFHAGEFQKSYEIYKNTINHLSFKKQSEPAKERWQILEAFIFFFLFIKKITPSSDNPLKTFRISKFLNEVPLYSKDKRGTNISIIILQVLFLLQQQKYGDIIDRMESLKAYTQRYLRQDDTFRSNCFIQMLLTLPECSFHKKAILRKSEKHWKKLQEVPLNVANQSAEIEIVPYEMLWEFVLESLDEKWH